MAFLQTPKAQFGTIIIDFMLVFFQENVVKSEDEFEKTKPGKGAITSQFYRTNNIPERFNNPGTSSFFLQITKLI